MSGPNAIMTDGRPSTRRRIIPRFLAVVKRVVGHVASIGIASYPPDVQRRLKIVNVIAALIVITNFIYAMQLAASGDPAMRPVVLLNLVLVAIVATIPLFHRFSDVAGSLWLITAEFAALIGFAAYFGRTGGNTLQYVIAAAAPFVIFDTRRIGLIVGVVLSALALHLFAWFAFPRSKAWLQVDDDMLSSLYVQGAVTTFGLIAACVYYAFSLAERAKAETEALLRNTLPSSVVDRLKANPDAPIADGVASASILFADITGFVALARSLGPEKTVAVLNDLVRTFDALCDIHNVEKIKTIGDAYMVAAGVPERGADDAIRLTRMALEMQCVASRLSIGSHGPIRMRMGMATGPVMAGVIGTKKFTYDVWGDAVNLASRLEAAYAPGAIMICPATRAAVGGAFKTADAGDIDIRGVGNVRLSTLMPDGVTPEFNPSNAVNTRV